MVRPVECHAADDLDTRAQCNRAAGSQFAACLARSTSSLLPTTRTLSASPGMPLLVRVTIGRATNKESWNASRTPLAQLIFEVGQNEVIVERLDELTLFDVSSVDDSKTAIQFAREGKAALLQIYPTPMTEAQAPAWLADFDL
jgi:hypothetical protein